MSAPKRRFVAWNGKDSLIAKCSCPAVDPSLEPASFDTRLLVDVSSFHMDFSSGQSSHMFGGSVRPYDLEILEDIGAPYII